MEGGEDLLDIYKLIELFRNIRRIENVSEKALASSHSVFLIFQGSSDDKIDANANTNLDTRQDARSCGKIDDKAPLTPYIYRLKHYYNEYYYLVEVKRPKNQKPKEKIQRKIQEKLANDPRLTSRIKSKTQQTTDSSENIDSTEKAPVGSFHASYTTSTDYKLQDHWILDSGSDVHVCNGRTPGYTPTREATAQDKLYAGKTTYDIESFGIIKIDVSTPEGTRQIELLDTAYVPGFMTNLVSLSRLVRKDVHQDT